MSNEKKIIEEVWSLWESMAECGELRIGPQFSANYDRLKPMIKSICDTLNKAEQPERGAYLKKIIELISVVDGNLLQMPYALQAIQALCEEGLNQVPKGQ